jgi:hypothetical protein
MRANDTGRGRLLDVTEGGAAPIARVGGRMRHAHVSEGNGLQILDGRSASEYA